MGNENKTITFEGEITKKVYDSPTFKIYGVKVDKNDYPSVKFSKYGDASIVGDLPDLVKGSVCTITAVEDSGKYGCQYRVKNITTYKPTNADDSYAFLKEIVTENQANTLINAYPDIVQKIIDNDLDDVDLSKMHGIGKYTFDKIKEKVIDNFKLAELVIEFNGTLTLTMIKKLYDRYTSVDTLKKHLESEPYTCLTNISGVGFKNADDIIIKLQNDGVVKFAEDIKSSRDRCLACVVYMLQKNEDEGNTKMNLADLRRVCIDLTPACAHHFTDVIKDKSIYYNKETMDIALAKTHDVEEKIARIISNNVRDTNAVWDFDIENYRRVEDIDLSDEQMRTLYNVCNNNVCILNGFAGCVDCDTEFFNGYGWEKISEYKNEDMVLQYNEDGTAQLVRPLAYIKHPAEYLWHFQTKYGLNQCLSDNHNCYYVTSKGNLYHKTFKEIREDQERNGFHGSFITTFDYSGYGIDLSDNEIRLMVATFADGSFYNNAPYNKKYNQARFHFKKDRKKQRLIEIIDKIGIDYKESISAAEGYTDYYVDVPFRGKHFPKEWYNCTKHQLEVIADEVMFWDGNYKKNNGYSTTSKEDADFIQFVFSSLGYRATINVSDRTGEEYLTCGKVYKRKSIEYSVSYTNRTLIKMCTDNRDNHHKTEILPYKTVDGYEYCFTVPSHMLVLRRGNRIFITGNSGKSFSTKALINMLEDNGKTYMLMAPTGKAAKVLSNFTQRKTSTIHRGLGYNPIGGWLYNEDNKLDADIVVIDEFSMVDVWLFLQLINAIDFNRTKLLLIGDNAQLCSVGCGNLLHDFMNSKVIPTVTLTKIFRYGEGGLMKAATDIRNGIQYLDKSMKSKVTVFGNDKDYTFIDTPSENISKSAVALYKKLMDNGVNPENIQVLTAKNVHECGSIELNNMLQKVANKNYGIGDCMKVGDSVYYVGDIVLQKKNNYNASVVEDDDDKRLDEYEQTAFVPNGDSGVIKRFVNENGNKAAIIDFNGILVKYYAVDMTNVGHGYAMSIHKSQGSGIDYVIVCTPKSHTFMLNSNLLYVALTRTKKKCYHFGNIQTINNAMRKKENMTRDTFMKDMLIKMRDDVYDHVE